MKKYGTMLICLLLPVIGELIYNICPYDFIVNIEATVTRLDCNHGVCPQTQGALTCTITGSLATWYSPPSDSTLVATVSSGLVSNVDNTGFTAALVSNISGLTTNLSFTATTDKNGTQVRCSDVIDQSSMTCTIMISGMSLTVSYITNYITCTTL